MSNVLLSMVGRPGKEDNGDYRTTDYVMPDGQIMTSQAMTAKAITNWKRFDKIVFLGTPGSAWDQVFYLWNGDDETLLQALEQANQTQTADDQLLAQLTQHLCAVGDVAVEARIADIDMAEHKQAPFIQQLADLLTDCTQLSIDVTFGLRAHPMFALTAAFFLQRIKQIHIDAIYYGQFDREKKQTPLHDMKGLLDIMAGVNAIEKYDQSGDYSLLSEVVGHGEKELSEAAFFERVCNANQAKNKLMAFKLSWQPEGVGALFQDELEKRMGWIDARKQVDRELKLARQYLKRKDYVRAIVFGLEGLVSKRLYDESTPSDEHKVREETSRALASEFHEFKLLRAIRNELAHSGQVKPSHENKKIKKALSSQQEMDLLLNQLFNELNIR